MTLIHNTTFSYLVFSITITLHYTQVPTTPLETYQTSIFISGEWDVQSIAGIRISFKREMGIYRTIPIFLLLSWQFPSDGIEIYPLSQYKWRYRIQEDSTGLVRVEETVSSVNQCIISRYLSLCLWLCGNIRTLHHTHQWIKIFSHTILAIKQCPHLAYLPKQ